MFPFWYKLVISREPLEHRPFANGYGAILFRMSEPAISESIELRRHGRGGLVPAHTPINSAVGLSRIPAVAFRDNPFRPIAPCAALPGRPDTPHVEGRKPRAEVKPVIRIAFTCLQLGQITDNFPYCLHMYLLGRRRNLDVSKDRCNQYHALPKLRKTILWTFNNLMTYVISKIVKSVRKSFKDSLVFQFGDILHRDKLRLCLIDEPRKLVKQQPSLVSPSRLLVVL